MKGNFLYQINFNRKKFPEICEALEDAKKDNGVAFYLRTLIQRDIDEKKGFVQQPKIQIQNEEKVQQEKVVQTIKKEEPAEILLEDDTGGFC